MNTMVKIVKSDHFIHVTAISRAAKIRDVWIDKDVFDLFVIREKEVVAIDGSTFFVMNKVSDKASISLTRINTYGSTPRIDGTQINVKVPCDLIDEIACTPKGEWKYLFVPETPAPELIFTESAQRTLKEVAADKKARSAFSKCIRNAFSWYGAKAIRIWRDFGKSFYFEEELMDGRTGICGGIVCHEYDGKVSYGIHT